MLFFMTRRRQEEPKPLVDLLGEHLMYEGPDNSSADLQEDQPSEPEPQIHPLDVTRLHRIAGYENVLYHKNSTVKSLNNIMIV